jgi:hypothetical protein
VSTILSAGSRVSANLRPDRRGPNRPSGAQQAIADSRLVARLVGNWNPGGAVVAQHPVLDPDGFGQP